MENSTIHKHRIDGGHVMFSEMPIIETCTNKEALELIKKLSDGFIAWTTKERLDSNKKKFKEGLPVWLMDGSFHYTINPK